MIYFDNSATTLTKPHEVAQAVSYAIEHYGNHGRSFYEPAMQASRVLYAARREIARLAAVEDALHVAFTSGATESLNLVLRGLVRENDTVITTVFEHNAVLRTLYDIGCKLAFINCGDDGALILDDLTGLLDSSAKFLICTHASNVLGSITDIEYLYGFCREHGLTLILDGAQTMGRIHVKAGSADVICFSGHKTMFGPMGTGGVIAKNELPVRPVKTGGTGTDSFSPLQPACMPDVFEAGTVNVHGIAGLKEGAAFINNTRLDRIQEKEQMLAAYFLDGLRDIQGVRLYGPRQAKKRLPIFSLNINDSAAEDVSARLWEDWKIATRAGAHCAPLVHERFETTKRGMVRFSLSWFNTREEIDTAVRALGAIARET